MDWWLVYVLIFVLATMILEAWLRLRRHKTTKRHR